MLSLKSFQDKYAVEANEVVIGGRKFKFFLPESIDQFINSDNLMDGFPLWAKIWPAGLVLADFICSTPVDPEKRFLEIGAGIGVVGIAAAAFGHRVTLSEYDPAALDFIRANALLNGCENLPIKCIDWKEPYTDEKFDKIMGSEVIYKDEYFPFLERLLEKSMSPGGEVFLSSEMRKSFFRFMEKMREKYQVQGSRRVMRSGDEELPIILCRMRPNPT